MSEEDCILILKCSTTSKTRTFKPVIRNCVVRLKDRIVPCEGFLVGFVTGFVLKFTELYYQGKATLCKVGSQFTRRPNMTAARILDRYSLRTNSRQVTATIEKGKKTPFDAAVLFG